MTNPKPQSRKIKVAALSFGKVLTGITTLVVFAVLSRVFANEKADYAAFRQTLLAFMMVAPFLTLGLNRGIFYFLPNENERVRGRVIDSLLLVLGSACIFSLFIGLGGNQLLASQFSNPQVASLLILMIPFFFANIILRMIDPILTCQERVVELAVYNILSRILIGALTIVPVLIWMTPSASIIGRSIGGVLASVAGLYLVFRFVSKDSWRPSKTSSFEMIRFSFPVGLATMISYLNLQLDKFIVSSMATPEEAAVFLNGAIEIPIIGIFTGSITTVLMVDMRKAVSENRNEDAVKLFRMTATKTATVLFPIAIYLMIFADSFICTLFSEEYVASAVPFRIYLWLIPFRTVAFGALMLALGLNVQILFRSCIGLLLNLALSVFMVNTFGPIGAAISTVTVVIVFAIPACLFFLSKRLSKPWYQLLPFKEFGLISLRLVLFLCCMLVLTFLLASYPHWLRLVISAAVAVIWMAFYWHGKIYNAKHVLSKLGF